MVGKNPADPLHNFVAQIARNKFQAARKSVEPALESKQSGQPVGAQILDYQKGVLAVRFGDIERTTVQVFSVNRQILEIGKHVTADFGEFGRIIRADIKDFGLLLFGKRVEADGEDHDLAGAT